MLMDKETFLSHEQFWVKEKVPFRGSGLSCLTKEELELYEGLRDNLWGQNLRLEQEKVYWPQAWSQVEKEAAL
jgi:hypothetical protein